MDTTTEPTTVKLPTAYARDWFTRCGRERDDWTAEMHMTSHRSRIVTLVLDAEALADLISDARHYTSSTMRGEYAAEGSGGIVKSADATLARLDKAGLL